MRQIEKSMLNQLIEKYDLMYDDWGPEIEEQREWDRKLAAGEIV